MRDNEIVGDVDQQLSLVFERALGSNIWIRGDETPYIDMIMGFGSTNFGHANPNIVNIVQEAAARFDNLSPFTLEERDSLSESLVRQLPFRVRDFQVYYTIGGAKCVESSIELARMASGKKNVVSFSGSFHGYATSVIGVSDRRFFTEKHNQFDHSGAFNIDFPTQPEDIPRVIGILRQLLSTNDDIACVIIEIAQGLAGFRAAPTEFYAELQKAINEYKVLLIVDDILMGVGRVGALYSFAGLGLTPDLVLLGKSLAGGYYPLSAIIGSQALFDRAGVSCTGLDSTFANNPFGIAVADGIQKYITATNLYGMVQPTARQFEAALHFILDKYKKDIVTMFVFGFAASIRFASRPIAKQIMDICREEHIFIQLAGVDQDHIRMTPSILISSQEIERVARILDKAIGLTLDT